jgi:alpha-ketoglutaric semialdehyde dehydrogenase
MSLALLLIDAQNDFLSQVEEPHRERLIDELERHIQLFRRHSLPIYHVRTEVNLDPDTRMPHWREQDKRLCLTDSLGSQAPLPLQDADGEPVFGKTFFSAFSNPNLLQHLAKNGVTTVILGGTHTHACLKQSALDAYSHGFQVIVAAEAVGSYDPVQAAFTLNYLDQRGIRSRKLFEIEALLAGSRTFGIRTAQSLASALISGQEHTSEAEAWCHSSPLDGSALWTCVPCDERLILEASKLACQCQRTTWRHTGVKERCRLLSDFAERLENHREALVNMLVKEVGKPRSHAEVEITASIAMIESVVSRLPGDTASEDPRWRRCPIGTVALITPYNNPIMIPVGKFVPALAFGNTVVWKPSPYGSALACFVAKLLHQTGLPSDALQVLCGGEQTAKSLMRSPHIQAVTLSGGLQAGYVAKAIQAERQTLLQAELGGNNAAVIWGDVDLEQVAKQVVRGAFGFAGQRCTSNRRLIVAESSFEQTLEALRAALQRYPVGDPENPSVDCGPVISARHLSRLQETVTSAQRYGCATLSWSRNLPAQGFYLAPSILWDVDPQGRLVQEESFGPLLVIQHARTFEQALELCNGVKHGLAAALFSQDSDLQRHFLDQAQAGILKLNEATSGARPEVPFGGWKASGLGPPEHGPADVEFYTRFQAVYGGRG